ncbi:unnamed protein product [Peniophora sp. CBMAI 1063]|nr:unnamed protein product [Peniophora sp. CBMAI 1063]
MASLPDDLVRDLFDVLSVVDPPRGPSTGRSLGWISATHVCQRWRAISISLPKLWASVVCTFPPDATVLERAQDAPLTIDLDMGGRRFWDETSISLIIARTQAIKDVEDVHREDSKGVDWRTILDGRRLPVLLEFNVRTVGYDHIKFTWRGSLEAPALRTCAFNLYLPLQAPSLRFLSISGYEWNVARLLSVLMNCSALSQLKVHGVWSEEGEEFTDDGDISSIINSDQLCELPNLQTLHVNIFDDLCVNALNHIQFPNHVGLRVDDTWRLDVWDYAFSRLHTHSLHGNLSIICTTATETNPFHPDNGPTVHRLTFTGDPSLYTRAIDILHGVLVLSKRSGRGGSNLHELLDRVPSSRASAIQTLDFDYIANNRFHREELRLDDIPALAVSLQRFHNVATLRVGDAGIDLLAFLASEDHVLFPDLHTLIVHPDKNMLDRERWSALRKMLITRRHPLPRLIIRGSMLCHTTEWQRPGHDHSWKQILDDCYISLEEEKLLVDELLDEREGIENLPYCRCWAKICGY